MSEKKEQISRRKFIGTTAKGTVGVVGLSLLGSEIANAVPENENRATSKVYIIEDSASGTGSPNWTINQNVVQNMMDAGIKRMTGICDLGEAWKSLFPGITSTSVICIKVNCLFVFTTHKQVTFTVIEGLKKMMVGNPPVAFPENNIIIFDASGLSTNGGYTINTGSTGVRCFHTSYGTQTYDVAGSSQKLSTVLTNQSNYMINLAVLKNHSITGTTLSMKNHYGTCNNPGGLHGSEGKNYLPALNNLASIKSKQVICIMDAIFGVISGGPSGNPNAVPKKLLMSKDTVAIDRVCTELLKSLGMPTSSYTMGMNYVNTAGAAPYNLGNSDLANIEQITITNPSSNAEPTATITEPVNGQVVLLGNNPTVKITPADSDGTISQVELYLNGTLNKTFTASPYETTLTGLAAGVYKLIAKTFDNKGEMGCSQEVSFTVKDITEIDEHSSGEYHSDQVTIFRNYPNPVHDFTTFSYRLHKPANVNIKIFNAQGALVSTLTEGQQNNGDYNLTWTPDPSITGGLYIVNFRINDILHSVKINVIK